MASVNLSIDGSVNSFIYVDIARYVWFSIAQPWVFYFCLFRYILNYLRTGKLIHPSENKVLQRELYLEAEFYQISGIRKELWLDMAFENSNFIINSLTREQKKALLSWLPARYIFCNWRQLYSPATIGWSTTSFHQNCDNKGPTVTIARSGNYIFGGYAEHSWNSGKK